MQQSRRRARIGYAVLVIGAMCFWIASEALIEMLHAGSIPILAERVFRSRDEFGLDFYSGLLRGPRQVVTGLVLFLGAVLLVHTEAPRVFSTALDLLGSINRWTPQPGIQTVAVALFGLMAVVFAVPYFAIAGLESDMSTYRVIIERLGDPSLLAGDYAVRVPDPALVPYASLVGVFASVVGMDAALFGLYTAAVILSSFGLYRMAREVFAGNHAAGLQAAFIGTGLALGALGYSLTVVHWNPSPRMFGLAISIHAVVQIMKGRLASGSGLGLLATAISTLDGLIPVLLALSATLASRAIEPRHPGSPPATDQREGEGRPILFALGVFAFALVSMTITAVVESRRASITLMVLIGSGLISGLLFRSIRFAGLRGRALSRVLLWIIAFSASGAFLSSFRAANRSGSLWDTLRLHETVYRDVRDRGMLSMFEADSSSVFAFLLLGLLVVHVSAMLLRPVGSDSETFRSKPNGDTVLLSAIALATVVVVFVVGGSLLMEWMGAPLLTTLWPIRSAWVLLAVGVPLFAAGLTRGRPVAGIIPTTALALAGLTGPLIGSEGWGLLVLLGVVGFLSTNPRPVVARYRPPGQAARGARDRQWTSAIQFRRFAARIAPVSVVLGILLQAQVPEIQIAQSAVRLRDEGGLTAAVIETAELTARHVPRDGRVLVPPDVKWSGFRVFSGRGVAFEFKQYSSSQPGLWYEHLRWMCNPAYRLDAEEAFEVGLDDIIRCYGRHSTSDILRVANRFDAAFGVIRSDNVGDLPVIAATEDGSWSLVAFVDD